MKLVHFDFDNHFLFDGRINVLVIEHGKYFRRYSKELIQQIKGDDGSFVLSDKDKQLSLSTSTVVIYDYFNLNFTDKKLINKLYANLTNMIQDKFSIDYANLLEAFEHLLQNLNAECDIPIDGEETSIQTILKAFGVHFDIEQSFIENLISYIEVMSNLCKIKLFCFINLKSYLSKKELLLFYDYVMKAELNIFLLESKSSHGLKNEHVVLIDEELCEIVLE